jgi:hypothetical protein
LVMAGGAQMGKQVALLALDKWIFKKLYGSSEGEGVWFSLTALAWLNLRLRAMSRPREAPHVC